MPPLHREHVVHGPFTLKGGKLTFRTQGSMLAQDASQAKAAGRDFTVTLLKPETKDCAGRVESVELAEGVKPAQWEVVMRVSA